MQCFRALRTAPPLALPLVIYKGVHVPTTERVEKALTATRADYVDPHLGPFGSLAIHVPTTLLHVPTTTFVFQVLRGTDSGDVSSHLPGQSSMAHQVIAYSAQRFLWPNRVRVIQPCACSHSRAADSVPGLFQPRSLSTENAADKLPLL